MPSIMEMSIMEMLPSLKMRVSSSADRKNLSSGTLLKDEVLVNQKERIT